MNVRTLSAADLLSLIAINSVVFPCRVNQSANRAVRVAAGALLFGVSWSKFNQGLLTLFESSLPEVIFLAGKAEGVQYSDTI